jgi:hypothetical protein
VTWGSNTALQGGGFGLGRVSKRPVLRQKFNRKDTQNESVTDELNRFSTNP